MIEIVKAWILQVKKHRGNDAWIVKWKPYDAMIFSKFIHLEVYWGWFTMQKRFSGSDMFAVRLFFAV